VRLAGSWPRLDVLKYALHNPRNLLDGCYARGPLHEDENTTCSALDTLQLDDDESEPF
jgi:hypothetical protein